MSTRLAPARRALALALAAPILLAACGGDGSSSGGGGSDDLSGSISIDGSSTVEPISSAIAEEFQREAPDVRINVAASGTGGGFKRFCSDEIDIADASRPIKDEEKQACASGNVDYTEFRVGLDGLAIVTSAENDFLECLSFEQLADIFKEGGASTWNEIDPGFPKEKIDIFAPGTDSGTYDFFVEEVLGDPKDAASLRPRSDYTASEDDNALVTGIKGEKNSFGYLGYAYYQENETSLKAIEVAEKGDECVAPSDETVEAGDYPLSRPLFIYVKNSALARPEVAEFVRFYLELAPDLVPEVGYTPAPAEDYEAGLEALEQLDGTGESNE